MGETVETDNVSNSSSNRRSMLRSPNSSSPWCCFFLLVVIRIENSMLVMIPIRKDGKNVREREEAEMRRSHSINHQEVVVVNRLFQCFQLIFIVILGDVLLIVK